MDRKVLSAKLVEHNIKIAMRTFDVVTERLRQLGEPPQATIRVSYKVKYAWFFWGKTQKKNLNIRGQYLDEDKIEWIDYAYTFADEWVSINRDMGSTGYEIKWVDDVTHEDQNDRLWPYKEENE